jgi:hypothetical protein
MRSPACRLVLALVLALPGCAPAPPEAAPLARAEALLDSVRYLRDQIDVTRARGASVSPAGLPLDDLVGAWGPARDALEALLAALPEPPDPADARALGRMRDLLARELRPDDGAASVARTGSRPSCRYDPARIGAGPGGADSLAALVFDCYGQAAREIVVDGDTLDRLTILGLLGATDDAARRQRLFRALDPVWRSVNGDDGPGSPYRELVRLRRADTGLAAGFERRAAAFGLTLAEAERWLLEGLEAWRAALPDTLFEPWDYYHFAGETARRFRDRVPRDSLVPLNHRFYGALGAPPAALGIRYDLEPRPGKFPIAFTTFGARRTARGPGGARSEPWVFASYRTGGFDNLAELLHETGHAVHIAAIDTRPAFHDWPDADPFTEGVADLATLEIYEPAWQWHWLGDSVPLARSLHAKYAAVMLDMAWALFEIRAHRPGAPAPNAVWTDLTRQYLRIRPHPGWSWWAMRGQLIESPGYMMNYALGAFLVADLRAALAGRHGSPARGDPGWYGRVSAGLFRFGAGVPARDVVRDFLGRAPEPAALLADLGRARPR